MTARPSTFVCRQSGHPITIVQVTMNRKRTAKPMPPAVDTALQILEPPRADTARYDRLRAAEDVREVRHA